MSHIQQTLVILKPDTMGRTIVGEIITRFERAGLHLVAMKMVHANKEQLEGHYEGIGKLGTRRGKKVLDIVVTMMMEAPILAMIREGVEVVDFVRKIVGSTEPKSAAPGTIRGDYAHMSYGYLDTNPDANLYNLIHASADLDEAKLEIPHWFSSKEIMTHTPHSAKFMR
jgi:nucleoside-diphosphate kinase